MAQAYGDRAEWDSTTIWDAFRDPRYIRVDGCPMLLIYRTASIAESSEMLDCWRNLAVRSGFAGLHVVSMRTDDGSDARELFDAQLEFEPFCTLSRLPFRHRAFEKVANTASRLCWRVFGRAPTRRAVSMTG